MCEIVCRPVVCFVHVGAGLKVHSCVFVCVCVCVFIHQHYLHLSSLPHSNSETARWFRESSLLLSAFI